MSQGAASRLDSLGFTQGFDYVPGLADWTANGLPTEGRLAEVLRAGDAVRQDVPACHLRERLLGEEEEASREVTFCVPSIRCEDCINGIEETLARIEEIEAVRAQLDGKVVTVVYHDGAGLESEVRRKLTEAGHINSDG